MQSSRAVAFRRASRAVVLASLVLLPQTGRAQLASAKGTALAATEGSARSAGRRVVTASRVARDVVLDGRLDDAAWTVATPAAEFVQQRPDPNASPTQRTEARVLFDAGAMYVGMRMHDSAADSMVAPLARRDYEGYSDWAQVLVDSYFDRRTAFRFAVNPSGAKRDALISGDIEWNEDPSWDAVWDVATSRDATGWSAEFRIPLTQLRFAGCAAAAPDSARTPTARLAVTSSGCAWGIQFVRDIARRSERSLWSPLPPDANGFVSHFGTLEGLAGLTAPRRMEILPYTLGRITRAPGSASNPFYRRNDVAGTVGADIKLGVTPSLTLTATINPDFGQVEADPSEVNLTGFETFFSERRPFFVEGSDIFRFNLASAGFFFGQDQLFYSRRVGRAPQGEVPDEAAESDVPDATTLLGAAKLSGKTPGGWSIGVLGALTGEETGRYSTESGARHALPVEPVTSYAVARVVKDFEEGASAIGVVATAMNRRADHPSLDTLRTGAYAGGLDWRRLFGGRNWEAGGNLLVSHVRGSAEAITETQHSAAHRFQRADARHLAVDSSLTSMTGLSSELRLHKNGGGAWRMAVIGRLVTRGFEVNDAGFQTRSDVGNVGGWVGYVHFTPSRLLRRWETWTNYWSQWSLAGERVFTGASQFGFVQFSNYWILEGSLRRDLSGLSVTALRGGPALFTNGRTQGNAELTTDPRRVVSASVGVRGWLEDGTDGRMFAFVPKLTVRPSSRAELSLEPSMSSVTNPWQYVSTETAAGTTSHLSAKLEQVTASLTTRLNYTFTPTLSFQMYAQPFLSAGRYTRFSDVTASRAHRFADRFRTFSPLEAVRGDGRVRIDRDGDGATELDIEDPDFNVGELRSNAVLRWEYRPGSTLFVVWSQGRDAEHDIGDFDLSRDGSRLWRAPGTNVLLVKASFWMNP